MASFARTSRFLAAAAALFMAMAIVSAAARSSAGRPAAGDPSVLCPQPIDVELAMEEAYYYDKFESLEEVKKNSLHCASLKSNADVLSSNNKDLVADVWNFIGSVLEDIANGSELIVQDLLDIAYQLLQQVGQLPAIVADGLASALAWLIEILTGLTPSPAY